MFIDLEMLAERYTSEGKDKEQIWTCWPQTHRCHSQSAKILSKLFQLLEKSAIGMIGTNCCEKSATLRFVENLNELLHGI